MQVVINGKVQEIQENITIHDLIRQIKFNHVYFAIAVNQKIIPKSDYMHHQIKNHDQIEIVIPHQGG